MALLNKDAKKKPLKPRGTAGGQVSSQRPVQTVRPAPCADACPARTDVRGWLTLVAQRERFGRTLEEALEAAFSRLAETNPFPATVARVCAAHCEAVCNRTGKDGAVSVNAAERWLGDWALSHDRPLPLPAPALDARRGRVAVLGAGLGGLSCAYHLARLGHAVVVYERAAQAGGTLRTSHPPSRLPQAVLDAELARLLRLGIELRLSTPIADPATLDGGRAEVDAVCVAVGASELVASGAHAPAVFQVRSGGDLPARSIEEGRQVALSVHALLTGRPTAVAPRQAPVGQDGVNRAAYEAKPRAERRSRPPEELARDPFLEADLGITEEQLLAEVARCYSCGMCHDCERCFLYCQNEAFEKLARPAAGHFYRLKLDACNGCKKCFNMCPCGCLDWV